MTNMQSMSLSALVMELDSGGRLALVPVSNKKVQQRGARRMSSWLTVQLVKTDGSQCEFTVQVGPAMLAWDTQRMGNFADAMSSFSTLDPTTAKVNMRWELPDQSVRDVEWAYDTIRASESVAACSSPAEIRTWWDASWDKVQTAINQAMLDAAKSGDSHELIQGYRAEWMRLIETHGDSVDRSTLEKIYISGLKRKPVFKDGGVNTTFYAFSKQSGGDSAGEAGGVAIDHTALMSASTDNETRLNAARKAGFVPSNIRYYRPDRTQCNPTQNWRRHSMGYVQIKFKASGNSNFQFAGITAAPLQISWSYIAEQTTNDLGPDMPVPPGAVAARTPSIAPPSASESLDMGTTVIVTGHGDVAVESSPEPGGSADEMQGVDRPLTPSPSPPAPAKPAEKHGVTSSGVLKKKRKRHGDMKA